MNKIFTYSNDNIKFKYIKKITNKRAICHRVSNDQLVTILYNPVFNVSISQYLKDNCHSINTALVIRKNLSLIDFDSDNIKLCGQKYRIIWVSKIEKWKKPNKFSDVGRFYIFAKNHCNYKDRKIAILKALHKLGDVTLNIVSLSLIAQLNLRKIKISITGNLKNWVTLDKNTRTLKISVLAYTLPIEALKYIIECKLMTLNSHEIDYDVYKKVARNYKQIEEIKKVILFGF